MLAPLDQHLEQWNRPGAPPGSFTRTTISSGSPQEDLAGEGAVGGSLKIVQHIEKLHPFGSLYLHGDLRACLAKQTLHFVSKIR